MLDLGAEFTSGSFGATLESYALTSSHAKRCSSMKSHETKPTILRCVHQSHEQKHMVAKSSFKHSFLASWCHSTLLPHHVFIQKPCVDGRKYPSQKENDTKSYKKLQKMHPNYSAAFSKTQTTATPPRWSHFETDQNLGGFVLQSSLGGEVVTIDESHEPWEIAIGFRVSGSFQVKGIFRAFLISDPSKKNKHVKTIKETTRIFLQFLLGLSKFVKSFLVVRLKGFPTKNQEWTNHLENLLAFYLSVGWPTFCHWKRQAEMIHPWSVWASPKGYFLRKGDWKTILTTPYLLGLC